MKMIGPVIVTVHQWNGKYQSLHCVNYDCKDNCGYKCTCVEPLSHVTSIELAEEEQLIFTYVQWIINETCFKFHKITLLCGLWTGFWWLCCMQFQYASVHINSRLSISSIILSIMHAIWKIVWVICLWDVYLLIHVIISTCFIFT